MNRKNDESDPVKVFINGMLVLAICIVLFSTFLILVAGVEEAEPQEAKQPTAFGCFVDRRWAVGSEAVGEVGDDLAEHWRAQCETMKAHGMNSAAFYIYDGPADLAEQVDIGLDTEFFQVDIPIIMVANVAAPGPTIAPGIGGDFGAFAREAKELSRYDEWPEVLLYGTDENVSVTDHDYIYYEATHEQGLRMVAGCVAPCIRARIPTLDVVLVAVEPDNMASTRDHIIEGGKTFGTYLVTATQHGDIRYDMMRYYAGIYSWHTEAEMVFVWSYRRLFEWDEGAGAKGFRDGVRDHRRLQQGLRVPFGKEAMGR